MNGSNLRTPYLALLLILLACTLSCDEIEDDIIEVGLLQVHPVLPYQTVPTLGEDSVQQSLWTLQAASIQLPDFTHDLAPGGDCTFQQSYISLSTGSGDCMLGAATAVSPSAISGVVSFTTEMSISRIGQADVAPGGDLDGDGVLNEDDNCPLVDNPGQETVVDGFGEDIGEACAFDTAGGVGDPVYYQDSELDEVPDIADNCPFHVNPDQENTPNPDLPAGFPSDGIGDACTETATVAVAGLAEFSRDVDVDPYVQERRRMLLVLDFGADISTMTCDWIAGSCDLDPATIRACVMNDRLSAASGCP